MTLPIKVLQSRHLGTPHVEAFALFPASLPPQQSPKQEKKAPKVHRLYSKQTSTPGKDLLLHGGSSQKVTHGHQQYQQLVWTLP